MCPVSSVQKLHSEVTMPLINRSVLLLWDGNWLMLRLLELEGESIWTDLSVRFPLHHNDYDS